MSAIADESEHGVDRPVAGAATVPKADQPRTQAQFLKPANSFQRIGRGVTQRRGGRPRYQKAKSRRSAGGQTGLSHLFIGNLSFSLPLPVSRTDQAQAKHEGLSHLAPFYRRTENNHDPTPIVDQSSDLSGQSQSEFASILADYAGKIDAARRNLPPALAAAVVKALANEQTVALRALSERLQATTKKKQDDKPIRTTGQAPQSNDRSL
jgi:DNA segregation ATPase FtsK/SpoIIIE-like protein